MLVVSGWQAVWPRQGCSFWSPKGATLEAETSHYSAPAAGISGLNSSADWEALDCIFYRITIERPCVEEPQRRLALFHTQKVNLVLTNLVYLLTPPPLDHRSNI